MIEKTDFAVVQLPELRWPTQLSIPSKRFRLLVAADVADVSTVTLADFATGARSNGMAYFCAWGRACERFHDIVDEIATDDDRGECRSCDDVIMTTWHADESLEEALYFLATCAEPTQGLTADSAFRLVICVGSESWPETAKQFLRSAEFFV